MPNILAVSLHASGVETVAGNGQSVDIGTTRNGMVVSGVVTALSGTSPAVAVTVETSADDVTFRPVRAVGTRSTVGDFVRAYVVGLSRYNRISWVVSGTGSPSVDFAVSGNAHAVYADKGDSKIHASRLTEHGENRVAKDLIEASAVASDYIGTAYSLPLDTWGPGLSRYVADIADYQIMRQLGFDPDGIDEETYRGSRDAAIKALKMVAAGSLTLDGVVDATPAVEEASAYTYSQTSRGWRQ